MLARESPRLQISTRGGLEVILPKRFKIEEVTNVLTQHKRWIERTWKRFKTSNNSGGSRTDSATTGFIGHSRALADRIST